MKYFGRGAAVESIPVIAALEAPAAAINFLKKAPVDVISLKASELPLDQSAREILNSHPEGVSGVVAVSDSFLARAAALNAALNSRGPSIESVALAADKVAMRKKFSEIGISTVQWAAVNSMADIVGFVSGVGRSIVKPRLGSASRHVFAIDGIEDPVLDQVSECLGNESGWIVEEFLQGPEFSVETLSWEGKHQVLAITSKETGEGFVEMGHKMPADLPDYLTTQVQSLVVEALDAIGVDEAVGHTEVILTNRGPIIVETHPRPGGDRIGFLVELTTGRHPLTALATLLGGGDCEPVSHSGGAAISFVTTSPGVVTEITGSEDAAMAPGIVEVNLGVKVGDTVAAMGSSADRCGYVIAVAENADEAACRAKSASSLVRVYT